MTRQPELSPWRKAVPFRRVLVLGMAGKDVRAVKRGLARAFEKRTRGLTPVFGPYTQRRLKQFQARMRLVPTGRYGPKSHELLLPWFDAYAGKLYGEVEIPAEELPLVLPAAFKPTHQTGGLAGYPAIDVFGRPGQAVAAPATGVVDKLSGKDPRLGGLPGGAYGWSIYLTRIDGRGRYFLTHFGTRKVALGQLVRQGAIIGTICDSAVSGKPRTSHIHQGYRRY